MNRTSSKDDAASYHYSTPEESMSSLPLLVKPKPSRSLFKNTVTSALGALPSSVTITEQPSSPLAVRVPEVPTNTGDRNESENGYERSSSTSLAPWEEAVTANGAPKIRLIPDVEVYLTPQQLAQVVQKAGNNPRKLVINLLEVFFSKETLAVSSAKGQRSAHNNKSAEKTSALPPAVVTAIKGYTIKHLKKPTGQCSLSDAVMNDVINSKCATARRAILKACPRNSEDNLN
ncbi:uncharacterized protein [Argopecten irradians]|uniref:uncharacterized protein n=1 Tax=Argopecten irradians TaxID=31199 RepID=UPI0037106650